MSLTSKGTAVSLPSVILVTTIIFKNIIKVSSSTQYNNEQCPSALQRETNTQLFYRFLELPIGATRVDCKVQASNDIYIGLFPSKSDSDFYEIVIGGWKNTQSVIRRCSYPPPGDKNSSRCQNPIFFKTMQFLNQHELRHFRIHFDSSGEVSVGRNYTDVSFMNWKDTADPLIVQFIGYSTGYGSTGLFRFCNFVNDTDLTSASTMSPLFMKTTHTSGETNLATNGKPLLWATIIIFVVLILTTTVIVLVVKRTKSVCCEQKPQNEYNSPSSTNPATLAEGGSFKTNPTNYETVSEEGAKSISIIHTYHETEACNKSHPKAPNNFSYLNNSHNITEVDERSFQSLDGQQNKMKPEGRGDYMQYIFKP